MSAIYVYLTLNVAQVFEIVKHLNEAKTCASVLNRSSNFNLIFIPSKQTNGVCVPKVLVVSKNRDFAIANGAK